MLLLHTMWSCAVVVCVSTSTFPGRWAFTHMQHITTQYGAAACQAQGFHKAACISAVLAHAHGVLLLTLIDFARADCMCVPSPMQACYLRLPPSARRACEGRGLDFREGVHAAGHALLNVLPLFMVCNSSDVGTEVRASSSSSSRLSLPAWRFVMFACLWA
jgi:hypothetical protein